MTSTATGAGAAIISNIPSAIKITRATIGKIVDPNLSDTQDRDDNGSCCSNDVKTH